MAHSDSIGTSTALVEYAGPLFFIGAQYQQTPLLTMTGGLTGGRVVGTDTYPMGNFLTLDAASATYTVTEDAASTAPASDIYAASQVYNYIELHQRAFEITYKSASMSGVISGEAVINMGTTNTKDPQTQRMAHLAQLAIDLEYSMLLGAGTDPSSSATNGKTTGIVTAVDADGSTEVDASSAALSKDLMESLEAAVLAATGAMLKPVILCGAYIKQRLNDLYGFSPESYTIGGVRLDTVNLPTLGPCGVAYDPVITSSVLLLADVAKIAPVFMPVPGKPAVFFEPLSKTGAGDKEQLYCQFGVDYGNADWHGIIKGLATS